MIRRFLFAISLLTLCLFAMPPPAAAYDFFGGAQCGGSGSTSTICHSTTKTDSKGNPQDPLTGPDGLFAKIANIVSYVAGAAAVIIIIVSGLRLVTSGSDVSTGSRTDTDVEDARRSLAGAVIGLFVIVLGRTLILYIVNRL